MGKRLVVWLVVLGLLGPGLAVLGPARPAAARSTEDLAPATPASTTAPHVAPEQPRLLVRFRPEASASARAAAIASIGGTVDRVLDAIDVTRVAIRIASDPSSDEIGLTALRLSRDPAVLSVEPDSVGSVQFTPNDSFYLTDPVLGLGQWSIRKAKVDQAWDIARGSPLVTVAVIDTGIDPGHPDLAGVALPGITFLTSPDPSCPAVVPGSTRDDNAHGTHVAGVIAANGNNGIGIAGVAFGVKILPIKALDCKGAGLMSDVASAVTWAADHGARIINVSLGSSSQQATLAAAVHYAVSHGVFVVAAAGNCGVASTRCGSLNEPSYPGAYPEVFAVAATDLNDQHATFSNVNSYVALAAPGARIFSAVPTYPTTLGIDPSLPYAVFSGTSQAAPFVAGVAALLLSKDPTLTVTQLADRLRAGADDLGAPGVDPEFGAGRVNALRSITGQSSAGGPSVFGAVYQRPALFTGRGFTTTPLAIPVTIANTSSFTWTVGGTNPVRLGYHWIGDGGRMLVWDGQRSVLPNDVPPGATVTVNATIPTLPAVGQYLLRLDLVREGIGWFSGNNVAPLDLATFLSNGLAASYAPAASTQSTFALGANTFAVTVANIGAVIWPAAGPTPVHLSYHWLAPDGSVVVWDGARASLPADIAPGQSAVVAIVVAAPPQVGPYTLRIDLVQEGVAWFSAQGVPTRDFAINVTNGFSASYAVSPLTPQLPGGRAVVPLTLRNDGLATWAAGGPNPIHVAAHVSDATGATVSWDGERSALPNDVAPGQSVTTTVIVNTPPVAGMYTVRVDLVREGIAWLSAYGVAPALVGLQAIEDYRASFQITATQVSIGAPTISVTVTNTSITTWSDTGSAPIDLSAHWLAADGRVLVWDGPRGPLGRPVAPGASVTVNLPLASPPPGAAVLVVDLVAEGLRWFGMGSPRPITLVP